MKKTILAILLIWPIHAYAADSPAESLGKIVLVGIQKLEDIHNLNGAADLSQTSQNQFSNLTDPSQIIGTAYYMIAFEAGAYMINEGKRNTLWQTNYKLDYFDKSHSQHRSSDYCSKSYDALESVHSHFIDGSNKDDYCNKIMTAIVKDAIYIMHQEPTVDAKTKKAQDAITAMQNQIMAPINGVLSGDPATLQKLQDYMQKRQELMMQPPSAIIELNER